jgi:chromosome segregation ATPase
MKVVLKKITLKDFKGISSAEFNFVDGENYIYGDNGTGKTTLYDSFLWVLFGKDHLDRADYRIKPILPDGTTKSKPECEVELTLDVDGNKLILSRIYKEKWTKPKTEPVPVYDGDTTVFYVNNISVSMSEYSQKVKELFPDINVFKSITNLSYFTSFKIEDQAKMLFGMIPEISNEEIAGGNKDILDIVKEISGVSIDAFKKDIASKKAKINSELDGLPDRIEGLKLGKPQENDWEKLEVEKAVLTNELEQIDNEILDASKSVEAVGRQRIEIQNKINNLQATCNEIKEKDKSDKAAKVNSEKQKIALIEQEIERIKSESQNREELLKSKVERAETIKRLIVQKEALRTSLLSEWSQIKAKVVEFPDGAFSCPTCKRHLEAHDIDAKQKELTENFNIEKASLLEDNKQKGLRVKADIEDLKKELAGIEIPDETTPNFTKTKIEAKKAEIAEIQKRIDAISIEPYKYLLDEKYVAAQKQIAALTEELNGIAPKSNEELINRKSELNKKLDAVKKELNVKTHIENTNKLIVEHEEKFAILNQELANLEKKEFDLKRFEFARRDAYEDKVNSLFKIVKFKLFKEQKDGQIVPTCEAMIDGVPYGTLNNAKKVAAGLDIIEAISRNCNLYAPIFIDNREGVVRIPETSTQIINLSVRAGVPLHISH